MIPATTSGRRMAILPTARDKVTSSVTRAVLRDSVHPDTRTDETALRSPKDVDFVDTESLDNVQGHLGYTPERIRFREKSGPITV
jgi:hypothetical protein